jgi:hypothetical protein
MIQRYWVNCPSTLQDHHDLHGAKVLCDKTLTEYGAETVRVYFTKGDIISMLIDRRFLSAGWPTPSAPAAAGED